MWMDILFIHLLIWQFFIQITSKCPCHLHGSVTAGCTESERGAFLCPPALDVHSRSQQGRCLICVLVLSMLQFVSSFQETELEASCVGCTVLGYR